MLPNDRAAVDPAVNFSAKIYRPIEIEGVLTHPDRLQPPLQQLHAVGYKPGDRWRNYFSLEFAVNAGGEA